MARHIWILFATALWGPLPPECEGYGPRCLYAPAAAFRYAESTQTVSYRDAAGLDRTVTVRVRVPGTSQVLGNTLLPVVVWSGGEMTAWSEATAGAGFLTVTVLERGRTGVEKAALCRVMGMTPEVCETTDLSGWDRVNDVAGVLTALETINRTGATELRGRIDMGRLAVAGWDRGAGAALSMGGAARLLRPGATRKAPDLFASERVAAIVAISPPALARDGFFDTDTGAPEHSWQGLARPVLMVTGAGDNNCSPIFGCDEGDAPSVRAMTFELMPAGGKGLLFLRGVNQDHAFLGSLDVDDCEAKGVDRAECAAQAAWLRSTVLAFLDARLNRRAAATVWLERGLIGPASAGMAEWRQK